MNKRAAALKIAREIPISADRRQRGEFRDNRISGSTRHGGSRQIS